MLQGITNVGDKMKIIKIGAVWCPGCLMMQKVWNNIKKNNKIKVEELDYDIDTDKVSKYNIGQILPVIIFLNDSEEEISRLVGEQTEKNIQEIIDKYRS